MNTSEARSVILAELEKYRAKSYSELVRTLLTSQDTYEVGGPSGAKYQVEIQAFWDGKPNEVLRVRGAIDDGGLRAYAPLAQDFLIAPNGKFVDE